MSFRIDRINSELQKSISEIVRNRIKNPNLTAMVSVMTVDTAKDLKTAKVYVSIYGSDEDKARTYEALRHSANFIRKELSSEFRELRTVPLLNFLMDDSQQYGSKIDSILEELKNVDTDGKH